MPQSNIGRVVFTNEFSPAAPLVVELGNLSSSAVKDITVLNTGSVPFYCFGTVVSTNTSPVMALFPGQRGTIVLNGSAGNLISFKAYKFLDPRYISLNSTAPVEDTPASFELEDLGS